MVVAGAVVGRAALGEPVRPEEPARHCEAAEREVGARPRPQKSSERKFMLVKRGTLSSVYICALADDFLALRAIGLSQSTDKVDEADAQIKAELHMMLLHYVWTLGTLYPSIFL